MCRRAEIIIQQRVPQFFDEIASWPYQVLSPGRTVAMVLRSRMRSLLSPSLCTRYVRSCAARIWQQGLVEYRQLAYDGANRLCGKVSQTSCCQSQVNAVRLLEMLPGLLTSRKDYGVYRERMGAGLGFSHTRHVSFCTELEEQHHWFLSWCGLDCREH